MKKILLCLVAAFVFSCEKPSIDGSEKPVNLEKPSSLPSIQNQDGILKFSSAEDLLIAVDQIGAMKEDEYSRWSSSINFKSRYLDYLEETKIEGDTSRAFAARDNGALIKNIEDGFYHLNSINSNYAKITNTDGIVYIGDETYMISYESIKVLKGTSKDKVSILKRTTSDEDFRRYGILNSKITSVKKNNINARTSDEVMIERKVQQGGDLKDDAFWDWYVLGIFEVKGYCMPCTPIFPGTPVSINRYTTTIEANYWADGLLTQTREIPQRYEINWSAAIWSSLAPNGIPVTGSYTESNVRTVLRTLTDGINSFFVSYDISVKAFDYKGSDLKSSEIRIVRSQ